ncbi:MAG: DUF2945 domain-containing protein [Leptolyngbyaceae cyanobacterium]
MSQKFRQGDKVAWNSGQGEATGTVEEYLTEAKTVDGQTVDASKSDPRYLVKNDNTGNVTGHKPESLSKANSKSQNSSSKQSSSKQSSSSSNNSSSFQSGDQVEWNTSQGKTTGKVVKKLTSSTQIKGHTVSASKEEPQYLVESDKTGEQAAHKPDALSKAG